MFHWLQSPLRSFCRSSFWLLAGANKRKSNRSSMLRRASRQLSSGAIVRIFVGCFAAASRVLLENENCENGNHRRWRLGNGASRFVGKGWAADCSLGPQRGSDRTHAKEPRKQRLSSRASATSFRTHYVGSWRLRGGPPGRACDAVHGIAEDCSALGESDWPY